MTLLVAHEERRNRDEVVLVNRCGGTRHVVNPSVHNKPPGDDLAGVFHLELGTDRVIAGLAQSVALGVDRGHEDLGGDVHERRIGDRTDMPTDPTGATDE